MLQGAAGIWSIAQVDIGCSSGLPCPTLSSWEKTSQVHGRRHPDCGPLSVSFPFSLPLSLPVANRARNLRARLSVGCSKAQVV